MRRILFGAFCFLAGCATPHYGARIEMFGAQFADASAINRVEMSVPDADAESVQVFFGSLPAGLQSQSEGLSVVAGYPHRILGRVSTTGLDGYNEDRRGYCKSSVFGAYMMCVMGGMLPPLLLACPCVYGYQSNQVDSIEARKAALVTALRRVTRAAGGNAVVIDELGKTLLVDGRTKVQLGSQPMTGAAGWAVVLAADSPPAQ